MGMGGGDLETVSESSRGWIRTKCSIYRYKNSYICPHKSLMGVILYRRQYASQKSQIAK